MWKFLTSVGAEKKSPATAISPAARLTQVAAESLAVSAAWTQVTFDTQEYDTDGLISGSTFVVKKAGLYRVSASIGFALVNATGYRIVQITKNSVVGNTGVIAEGFAPGNNNVYNDVAASAALQLAVGDVIRVFAYQSAGVAVGMNAYPGSMYFTIEKIDGAVVSSVPGGVVGQELDYAQITASDTAITGLSSAAPTTVITGNPIICDGVTPLSIEFISYAILKGTTYIRIGVYMDGNSIGEVVHELNTAAGSAHGEMKYTPTSGSHTFSIRAYVDAGTGHVFSGIGGAGNPNPTHMRVKRAA